MGQKQTEKRNYYCRACGARFGDDGRAFEVGTLKNGARDWHCYFCKIDETSPDALREFAKIQLSKKHNETNHENKKVEGKIKEAVWGLGVY